MVTWARLTHLTAHFGVGFFLVTTACRVPVLQSAPVFWFVAASLVGLGKELRDWTLRGRVAFDWPEWLATVAGAGAALVEAWIAARVLV